MLFKYTVKTTGKSAYVVTFEETSRKKADEYVEYVWPKEGHTVTFLSKEEGTIDEFIGEESISRIDKAKSTLRQMEEDKKKARQRMRGG